MNFSLKKALIFGSLTLFLLPSTAFASFSDVDSSNKYYDAIIKLQQEGVIKGYADGTFKPENQVSRAELLKMAFSHVGYTAPDAWTETHLLDVPAASWFAPYVQKGLDLGIISATPSQPNFYPAAPITKVEALKIIMALEGIPATYATNDAPLSFDDVKPTSPYAYIVRAADNSGLFTTADSRYFRPYTLLTRGETAEFLYRGEIYRGQGGATSMPAGEYYFDSTSGFTDTELKLIESSKFPILLDVWSKIQDVYIHQEAVNSNQLIYGAVQGMVETLDDPYTIFAPPEVAQSLEDAINGTFEGIGTVLDYFDSSYIIVSVLKDSPAEKAGLKAGDIINQVDGQNLTGLTIDEVVNLIKGAAGSTVKLVIRRNSLNLTFKIVREEITFDTVLPEDPVTTNIPDNIAYLSIYQFTDSTGTEFANALKTALDKNPKGFILDLRDNPGGLLNTAFDVLGHFIKEDMVIANIKIAGNIEPQKSAGQGEFQDAGIPLVILVNDGSASASEVVAGALQDYKIGKLVGETTYGKGTVQEVTTYTDGSFFKISIAYWLTPLERSIDKIGLTPDIAIARTKEDVLNNTDSQLERAIAELQSQI
jgi:carboxyl-terminal processing protease